MELRRVFEFFRQFFPDFSVRSFDTVVVSISRGNVDFSSGQGSRNSHGLALAGGAWPQEPLQSAYEVLRWEYSLLGSSRN